MKTHWIAGWLPVAWVLLAATLAVAAPEDLFKGASRDGYDSQAAGFLISMNDAWGRMVGGTNDGYDKQALGTVASFNDAWGRMVGGGYDGYDFGILYDVRIGPPPGTVFKFR